jgi:hypothetical protein
VLKETIAAGVLVPNPVVYDSPAPGGATTARTRHAIASYRGGFMIAHSATDATEAPAWSDQNGAPPPRDPNVLFEFGPPSDLSPPPLAYGQIFQARAGFLGVGGVVPAGWGDPAKPWDTGALASTFADTPLTGLAGLAPKTVVLLRTVPPGPPRLLASPSDVDGSTLSAALTGPNDSEVRPLWRERAKLWDQATQARFSGVASCFLDPLAPGPSTRSVLLRPPSLSVGARTAGAAGGRVWRYWTQRDVDLKDTSAATRIRDFDDSSRVKQAYDDPAIIYPPQHGNPAAPPAYGGCIVSMLELRPTGPVEVQRVVVHFNPAATVLGVDGPCFKVSWSCPEGAATADLKADAVSIQATLPVGGVFALSFRTFADVNFFAGGSDPRFARQALLPAGSDDGAPAWSDVSDLALVSGAGYAFGEALIVFECLPDLDHLPKAADLWSACSLGRSEDSIQATYVRPSGDTSFDYIGSIKSTRQAWTWDGGPVQPADVQALFSQADLAEAGAGGARGGAFLKFEQLMMSTRGPSGVQTTSHVESNAQSVNLLALDLPASRGASYFRARFDAVSRYAPLRRAADPDGQFLRRQGQATGARGSDTDFQWKGLASPLRRATVLPTPRIRIAAPLFAAASPDSANAVAGGFAAMLDEAAFDTQSGPGLAGVLVAEVVVETLGVPGAPGSAAALAVGMDPALGLEQDPFTSPTDASRPLNRVAFVPSAGGPWDDGSAATPIKVSNSWMWTPPGGTPPTDGVGARFQLAAVLGETLEPSSASPLMPYASFLFDAILNPAPGNLGAGVPIKPGAMARVRFRYEVLPQAVAATDQAATAAAVASAWSAPLWVQSMARMDYRTLIRIDHVTLSGESVSIGLAPDTTGAPAASAAELFHRWANWPVVGKSDPVGPSMRLQAIVGLVVEDATGARTLRPKGLLTASVSAPTRDTNGHWSGGGVLFEGAIDGLRASAKPMLFIQLLEVQDFSSGRGDLPPPAADQTLQRASEDWLGAGDDVEASSRVIGFGPRLFYSVDASI